MNQETKNKILKYTGIVIAMGLVFGLTWNALTKKEEPITYTAPTIQEIVIDKSDEKFASKISLLKDEVIAELEKCESGGRKEEDGIVILDSNNKGSYGPLQFQRTTVIHYYKLMTGKDINGRDAIILALQGDKARELAKYVIFETKNGVAKDWVNCSNYHNLQYKVDTIKKLEN